MKAENHSMHTHSIVKQGKQKKGRREEKCQTPVSTLNGIKYNAIPFILKNKNVYYKIHVVLVGLDWNVVLASASGKLTLKRNDK